MLIYLLISLSSVSENRGITVPIQELKVSGDETDRVTIGNFPSKRGKIFSAKDKATWDLIDSLYFYGRVPSDDKWVIMIDSNLNLLPPSDTLVSAAQQAVESCSEWLKLPLEDNFFRMNTTNQGIYGNLILSTSYPYTDEVAFCVAHIDPQILNHYASDPFILVENAERIYNADPLLDYVELLEYPDYTTARYKISDHGIDTTDVEIPRDMYYWNIVHPILSDEAPLYINPATGNEASPPTGVFWRDYIFNYPDTAEVTRISHSGNDTIFAGFVSPILKDELSGEQILWDRKTDTTTNNGAIGIITKWIQDVMVFNSGAERPIQPVRIYHMHWGRCGEHADLTAAAGRASLIPTNEPLTMCNDHTWNEWYDEEWRGWEPVNGYVNSTHHYEGWGWDIVLPFNFRGDGWIWDVTERYSDICTLTVQVNDNKGFPVDGAMVKVASTDNSGAYLYYAGWHYTDSDGKADFIIGDNKPYYARIDSDIGYYPDSGYVVQVISNSVPGNHYNWSHNLTGSMPGLPVSEATYPSQPDSTFKVEIDFCVPDEIIYGNTLFQNELGVKSRFARYAARGNIEFFICDSVNHSLYGSGAPFVAFNIGEDVDSGDVSFVIPTAGKWYTVFSNEDALVNGGICSFTVKLYQNSTGIDEDIAREDAISGINVYPNPFINTAVIRCPISKNTDNLSIQIYDLSGRLIRQLPINNSRSPIAEVRWDGSDNNGRPISSGIYFCRFKTEGHEFIEKIIKIK